MTENFRKIYDQPDRAFLDESLNTSEEGSINTIDRLLFGRISNFMRAKYDLEEVENDPMLAEADLLTKDAISHYRSKKAHNVADSKFISDNLIDQNIDYEAKKEINEILQEITEKNISSITSEWVREWHMKVQSNAKQGEPATDNIREFITSSFIEPQPETQEADYYSNNNVPKTRFSRKLIKYISFAAAAMISVFFLINSLVPESNSLKLFNKYYEPLPSISNITRSNDNVINESEYLSAFELYKSGYYKEAFSAFSKIKDSNELSASIHFFMGLSSLQLKDFDNAVTYLKSLTETEGEYFKEATWYLGLAYLGKNNKTESYKYFLKLSETKGYYQLPSKKILRHLR